MSYLKVINDPDGPCVFGAPLTVRRHWTRINGPFPPGPGSRGRLQLNHRCDQPRCRNIGHVWLGTQSENMRDAAKKSRLPRKGSKNGHAKLTEGEVRMIRYLLQPESGVTQESVARIYGVAQITISNIVTRKRWKHVKGERP